MKLSAFDLDYTLIQGNCAASFCRYLYKNKVFPLSVMIYSFFYSLRHRFLGMSLAELHENVFNKFLFGKSLAQLEIYLDRFVHEYLNKSLYLPAFECLKKAQKQGHYTMILSNSPSFLVERFAKAFGVNAFQATEYVVDEEQRFHRIKRILEGKDKAFYIRAIAKKLGVFLDGITAYSDSVLDLDFLQTAGTAIAVNPDKELRKISIANQWRII